jgi:hypothetical protein
MRLIIPNVRPSIPYMVRRGSRNIRVPPLFMKRLAKGVVITSVITGRVRFHELLSPIENNSPKQKAASVLPLDRACKHCLHNKVRDEETKEMPSNKLDDSFGLRANVFLFIAFLFHYLRLLFGIFEHGHLINTLSCFLMETNISPIRETGVRNYEC